VLVLLLPWKVYSNLAFINTEPHSKHGHVASSVRISVSFLRPKLYQFLGKLRDGYETESIVF